MSLRMAVTVAAEIVGLTESDRTGMARRLERIFRAGKGAVGRSILDLPRYARAQIHMLDFYARDVFPAVAARRRAPREDVISHLIREGCSDRTILTECLTYAAAGMVTTREFITMAGWHLLERAELRQNSSQGTRPVGSRSWKKFSGSSRSSGFFPPRPGNRQDLCARYRKANADLAAVGACPRAIDPDRAEARGSVARGSRSAMERIAVLEPISRSSRRRFSSISFFACPV
jgi:hypothetical protein